MTKIAFIGLGNMGLPMAANLVRAGHDVTGFDLFNEAVLRAQELGVLPAESAADAARDADVVITMLPTGKHLIGAYRGPDGLLAAARPGSLFIDCSTVDIESATAAHKAAGGAGMLSVDAPVSGGVGGATAGTLTFMMGAEDAAAKAAQPILAAMGKKIVHCGGAGAGQAAKICNNMILGISMIAVSRSLRARRKARPVASGSVRCRLDLVGPMLVADLLLSGSRPGSRQPRQQCL